MKRFNREKGITLIALIITIIVMLILVGVTVAVAIQGDLFNIAGTAKEKTMEEAEKEKLWAAAMASVNETGKVIFSRLDSENLPKETFEGSNGKYTSKESGKTYLIDEYGNITVQEGESQGIDFDAIEKDLLANSEKYLEQARTLGQKTTTDVAIGTDGEVVNLDLWKYEKIANEDNTASLAGVGCGNDSAYIGEITEDGKIQGTIPQLIYSEGEIYKVTSTCYALEGLTELQIAPAIPSSVTDADGMFWGCTSLTEAPTIPSSVTSTWYMFYDCTSLKGEIIINASSISNYSGMLSGVGSPTNQIVLKGTNTTPGLEAIRKTGNKTYITVFDAREEDLLANSEKYLEQARSLGQKTTTDVAIGTDGKVVNLDLWKYEKIANEDNTASLAGVGCGNDSAYEGEITEDGKIQGTIPQLIYSEGEIYKVTSTCYALEGLTELQIAPAIPSSVTDADGMFWGCTSLTEAPTIPRSVTKAKGMFENCTSLTEAPTIPSSVTNAYAMFAGCTSLTEAPTIPSSVKDVSYMFSGCTSLTGEITINATRLTNYAGMLAGVGSQENQIVLKGANTQLEAIKKTGNATYITVAQ